MALQLRPTCENCQRALPPDSTDAMICSFECTFCRSCVEDILGNVCPNCGGGFWARPVRPKTNWKDNLCTIGRPPTTEVTHVPVDPAAHAVFAVRIRAIPPGQR